MACKWYAEFEGICCCGDCPECSDICTCEDKQNECEYYEIKELPNFDIDVFCDITGIDKSKV